MLWGVAAFAVVGFAYLLIRKADLGSGVTSVESPEPSMQPTVEKADDSAEFHLPTELVQRASEHWQRGERAEALSLLYRGTIRGLSSRHGIDIAPSMTARECTRRVREAGGPADYMSELARAWTSTAYADRPPTDETAEELFVTWRRHFGGHEG